MEAASADGNERFGACVLCGVVFDRSTIGRHVAACIRRKAGNGNDSLLVHAQSVGRVVYWMELVVRRDAPIESLDAFLREIWLDEPCGHLSGFIIGRRGRQDQNWRQLVSRGYAHHLMPDPRVIPMSRAKVDDVLSPKVEIVHEYDFGTTTSTTLRGVAECAAFPGRAVVSAVARNNSPQLACGVCEAAPVTQVCGLCYGSEDALQCAACARDHACGTEVLLPWLNSPRTGLCGYGRGDDEEHSGWVTNTPADTAAARKRGARSATRKARSRSTRA